MAYPYLGDLVKAIAGYDVPLLVPMFGICFAFAMLVATARFQGEPGRLYENGQMGPALIRTRGSDGPVTQQRWHPGKSSRALPWLGSWRSGFSISSSISTGFLDDPSSMILTRAGLTIFGGLILGTLVGLLFVKGRKLPLLAHGGGGACDDARLRAGKKRLPGLGQRRLGGMGEVHCKVF